MKKMTLLAAVLGLAFIVGAPAKSEAFCLFFGCNGDDSAVVVDDENTITDSSLTAGNGNTTAIKNSNSVIVGDSANTNVRNTISGMGSNRGDVNQSGSGNLTGQQNTHIHNNDMRSFRGLIGNNK